MSEKRFVPGAAVLIVAGSDPLGYSGLQADLRHLAALGVPGLAIPTCLTEQTREACMGIIPVDVGHVARAIRLAFGDPREQGDGGAGPGAVKLGLLHRAEVVAVVAEALAGMNAPLVLDPVLAAGGGGDLVEPGTMEALLELLVPRSTVVTPNIPELAALTAAPPARDLEERERQARLLLQRGAHGVIVKGGHDPQPSAEVCDLVVTATGARAFSRPRLPGTAPRGTGCALATLVAAGLAGGSTTLEAFLLARSRLDPAIAAAMSAGRRRLVLKKDPS